MKAKAKTKTRSADKTRQFAVVRNDGKEEALFVTRSFAELVCRHLNRTFKEYAYSVEERAS